MNTTASGGVQQIRLHSLMSTLAYQVTVLVSLLAGQHSRMNWMVRKVA